MIMFNYMVVLNLKSNNVIQNKIVFYSLLGGEILTMLSFTYVILLIMCVFIIPIIYTLFDFWNYGYSIKDCLKDVIKASVALWIGLNLGELLYTVAYKF